MPALGRRLPVFVLVPSLAALVLLLPVLPAPAADPQPVTPVLHTVDLSTLPLVQPSDAAGAPAGQQRAAVSAAVVRTGEVATRPYRLVAVTWDDQARAGVAAAVRYRSSGAWSSWRQLDTDDPTDGHGPDPGSGEAANARGGTEPLLVPASDGVQVRVELADGAMPSGLRADLVDPGVSPADASVGRTTGAAAAAAVTRPTILTRAEWGADESLREQTEPDYGTISAAFVHHTVNANTYSAAEVPALMRSIYAYHVQGRGWRDIGYNFLVDRFGRIWEGRYGGVDQPVIGAHTAGYNDQAFAMSSIGEFTATEPPPAMVDAYGRLFAWKFAMHDVDPTTVVVLDGVAFNTVSGHRDAKATECPGTRLYLRLPEIRTLTARYIGPPDEADRRAFVTALYRDFLDRPADPGGEAGWVAAIQDVSGRPVVAGAFAKSAEYLARRVDAVYRDALNRPADPGGSASWTGWLLRGATWTEMAGGVYGSEEAFNASGGSLTRWVDDAYRGLLGRPADPGGQAAWAAAVPSLGRHGVAAAIARSDEARARRVGDYYTTFLQRPADPAGMSGFAPLLLGAGDVTVPAMLAGSFEYWQRAKARY